MSTTKVMRPVTYKRQGDLVYIQQPDPVTGKLRQIVMTHGQALILVDWILDDLSDHGGGDDGEGEPIPEIDPETATADGCTRTRGSSVGAAIDNGLAEIGGKVVRLVTGGRVDPEPVRYINGEFGRS